MEKEQLLSGIAKNSNLEFVISDDLVNDYAFGTPTVEERVILSQLGFQYWRTLIHADTNKPYEMWVR